jgi:hypothetical protein
MEDKVNPKGDYTLLSCTVCKQNFGIAQPTMEDTKEIVETHMRDHNNVFYLVPPSKKKA